MSRRPFRFHSIYVPRVWGGRQLCNRLGRVLPDYDEPIGEAWEISDRPECVSIVKDGEWQGQSLMELWGKRRGEFILSLAHAAPVTACEDATVLANVGLLSL